jgi:multicomponent Na+:H+ antiporter subunit E
MIRAFFVRMLLLLALWWLLSEASVDALWIGVPTVALAALPGLRSRSVVAPRLLQLLRFGPAFIGRSLLAGVDVAARALRPDMGLHPALLEFRTDLPPGTPRVFFANLVSLLPGTLSADIEDCRLQIHVLDDRAPSEPTLRQLEGVVARLFKR